MKRWHSYTILFLLLLGITGGGIYYYKFKITKKEVIVSNIYHYIPPDAALIVEVKKGQNLTAILKKNSKPWSLLINIPAIQKINNYIFAIDSIYSNHSLFKNRVFTRNYLLSLHPSGKNNVNALAIFYLSKELSDNEIKSFLSEIQPQNSAFTEKKYNNIIIYTCNFAQNSDFQKLHFCNIESFLFISNSSILLEAAIRQSTSNYNLLSNPSFVNMLKTSGQNVEANIYFNQNEFSKIWKLWLNKNTPLKTKVNLGEWSALDIHISQNMFLLNGFFDDGDTLSNYLKLLKCQSTGSFTIDKILPKETHTYLWLSIPDFKKWNEQFNIYMEAIGKKQERDDILENIKKTCHFDFIKLINEISNNEFSIAVSTNYNTKEATTDDFFFIMAINNQSTVKETMDSLISAYARNSQKKYDDFHSTINIDKSLTKDIYISPITNIPQILLGKFFSICSTKYFIYIDNYLVFSDSKNSLQRFAYAYELKKTLSNETLYKSYTNMIEKKSNLLFYCDIARAKSFLLNFFNDDINKTFNNNYEIIQQLDALSFQLSPMENKLYANIYLRYSPEIKQNTHTIWESKLDTTISIKPTFVTNHNTGEKEIFVQDDANTIYLINDFGRILWKNTFVKERIISDVVQIDMFNNGKLQYLFSTKNYIYLIDRNGEIIEPFPIKLLSPATNGVSAIKSGKETLLFIACTDKKIYCYTLNGKFCKNWKFEKTNHFVYQPIQYVSIDKKEYIYFNDSLNIYITDKNGKKLIDITSTIPVNQNARLYYEPKNRENDSRFLINDISGKINYIYLNGKVQTINFRKFSSTHYFSF